MQIGDLPGVEYVADMGMVKVPFTIPATDTLAHYTDTLWYPPADFETLTLADVEAEQQRRYDNWVRIISPQPPTVEDLQAQAADLSGQIVALAQQHVGVHGQIKALDPEADVPGINPALVAQVAADDPSLIGTQGA